MTLPSHYDEKWKLSEQGEDFMSEQCSNGKLMDVLEKIPVDQWSKISGINGSLLHYACIGNNLKVVIMLLSSPHNFDINGKNYFRRTPAHFAVQNGQYRVLEILCVFGADFSHLDANGQTPLAMTMYRVKEAVHSTHVLIANGVRTKKMEWYDKLKPPFKKFQVFEQGVLRCRDVIIVLLGLKKRRQILGNLDRFLVSQVLAVEIWSTRSCESEKW